MAREHLLVGEEETIHSNQIVLETQKDKRKNWWHYNRSIVFGVLIGVALVGSMIYSVVSKVSPDYQIGLITSTMWTDDMLSDFENYISSYADDRNKDGKVVTQVNQFLLTSAAEVTDPNTLQAAVVRFSADSSSLDSVIFLHNAGGMEYFTGDTLEGFFNYKDGTAMPDGAIDYENAMYDWSEIGALDTYIPAPLEGSVKVNSENLTAILQRYSISVRALTDNIVDDKKKMSYYNDSMGLFERLKKNEKLVQE